MRQSASSGQTLQKPRRKPLRASDAVGTMGQRHKRVGPGQLCLSPGYATDPCVLGRENLSGIPDHNSLPGRSRVGASTGARCKAWGVGSVYAVPP